MSFATKPLPAQHDVLAPDGSEVRILLGLAGGTMAHFRLQPGQVSVAVTHRTVEEIWYVVEGEGEMWRQDATREEVLRLAPGTCLTIPLGTRFQFRCVGDVAFGAVGVTMPPWPGEGEAVAVEGKWSPSAGG